MALIDGSQGAGGGQILRSSLALSLITGEGLEINNIRARRSNPGLRAQHLAAVKAAAKIGKADTEGAFLGSTSLVFRPAGISPGKYEFEIGTAGSTSLVFQTICVPLSLGKGASSVTITGGTHVPASPSFHFLDSHWLPFLRGMGFVLELSMQEAGFYPIGGGRIVARVHPVQEIKPIQLTDRGRLQQIRGISAVANLDRRIAERQRNQVVNRLGARYRLNDIRIQALPGTSMGTMLFLLAEFEHSQACFFALGELGKPAEKVADEAVENLETFLATDGAIDPYLADQILLPLALASGVSQFSTSRVTEHQRTNASVIQKFLPVNIEIQGEVNRPGLVTIRPGKG